MTGLSKFTLRNGINLFVHPTDKFKTILVQLVLHRHLSEADATACSLLPSVLQRGCGMYPTRRELAYKLEELYGSELMTDVVKKGERQLVSFTLDTVDDRYLPAEGNLLRKGLGIMKEVLTDPVLDGNGFKNEYVVQEKEQHERVIRGLINDKVAYSLERCLNEMCKNEPFGVFKYGSLEKLQEINPENLYGFYRRFLAESPADLYVIGGIEPNEVLSLAEETFDFPRASTAFIPDTIIRNGAGEVRYVHEELDVNQGKLVLGFRTGITYGDDDYFPLLVYNGILGGFPHSKLFQNVREKASLAYYVYSRLEKHKGLMVIAAGIEVDQYGQALEIISQQVENMAKNDFSAEEFENTVRGLRNQLLVEEDNPGLLVNRALDDTLAGRNEDTQSLLSRLAAVTREDVAKVAEKVHLDTVYFLTNKGGGQDE